MAKPNPSGASIRVKCRCGKVLAAPFKAAGKQVQCPACKQPLKVPASASHPDSQPDKKSPPAAEAPKASASEKVKVKCQCGKVLAVDPKLAGKAVKCPQCQAAIRVPASAPSSAKSTQPAASSSSIEDLLDEAGVTKSKTGKRCPECRADIAPDAVLCVQCGYHLEMGKKLRSPR